jgi:hypothetical protein
VGGDGDDLVLEAAGALGVGGLGERVGGELVLLLAGDAVLRGNVLAGGTVSTRALGEVIGRTW